MQLWTLVRPFLALLLNNINIIDKRVKLVQPGYKAFFESSFNESYMCAHRKLSSPIS